jgi:hypothetical protein
MTFTIFFATSTGKTEDVADRLKELLPGAEAKDVDNLGSSDELVEADALVAAFRHGTQELTKEGLERHGMILPKRFQILISPANPSLFWA